MEPGLTRTVHDAEPTNERNKDKTNNQDNKHLGRDDKNQVQVGWV